MPPNRPPRPALILARERQRDVDAAVPGCATSSGTWSCCGIAAGLSYEQIAVTLEIPTGTVKRRLFDAMERLRQESGGAMSGREPQDPPPVSLAAYLEGEVTPSEAAAVERLQAASVAARNHLAELRSIRDVLAEPSAATRAVDLVPSLARALEAPRRAAGARRSSLGRGLAAAASIAVVVAGVGPASRDAGFRAKSAARRQRARALGRHPDLSSGPGQPATACDGSNLRRRDGLLFSYTNLGARPFSHLMIFGIDARGEVRWFHPAYEQPGVNPGSIPVRRGDADVTLAEVVHHDLPPGPLAVHALFTARPLPVLEVEAAVRQARRRCGRTAALPESADQVRIVEVTP